MNKNNVFSAKLSVAKRMEKETTSKDIYVLSADMYLKIKEEKIIKLRNYYGSNM